MKVRTILLICFSILLGSACTGFPGASMDDETLASQVAATIYAGQTTIEPTIPPQARSSPIPTISPTPTPNPKAITITNLEQVVEIARWGRGTVNQLRYSPDGDLLAVGTSIGIDLYDVQNLADPFHLETPDQISHLEFSPQGDILAASSYSGIIWMWRVQDRTPLGTIQLPEEAPWRDSIEAIAISPDGRLLATLTYATIHVWRTADGGLLHTIDLQWGAKVMAFSTDGLTLFAGGEIGYQIEQNWLVAWRVADGAVVHKLSGDIDLEAVEAMSFSPGGEMLAMGFQNGVIRLWETSEGSTLQTLEGHTDSITRLAFSPDSNLLASASRDDTVRVWGISEGLELHSHEYQDWITSLAFSPGGETLAVSTAESIHLWGTSSGENIDHLTYGNDARKVEFSLDGSALMVETPLGATVWDLAEQRQLFDLEKPYAGWVTDASFSPDGNVIAAAYYRLEEQPHQVIGLWDANGGHLLEIFERISVLGDVAFSPSGDHLATTSADSVVVVNVSDGTVATALEANCSQHDWSSNDDVVFAPAGETLAASICDEKVWVWDLETQQPIHVLEPPSEDTEDPTFKLAYSSDGEILGIASFGSVSLWQVREGNLLTTLEHPHRWVSSLAFSPDGTILATGSYYGITVWNLADGRVLGTLKGHTEDVRSLIFSPDGSLLVSGSGDGTVRFWGLP
jgi:WD40 repeat protein